MNTTLKEFYIYGNNIGDEGCVYLAEAIKVFLFYFIFHVIILMDAERKFIHSKIQVFKTLTCSATR